MTHETDQELIFDFPIDKKRAKEVALKHIRENIGSIPIPDDPMRHGNTWVVPIKALYPRIIQNAIKKRPERVRFMDLRNLGEIQLNADTGEITKKSGVVEVEGNIKSRLREVNMVIQKALVKVGSKRFALLPFPDLRFTPIQDVICNLLIYNKIERASLDESLYGENIEKYEHYLDILQTAPVELIRVTDKNILPGNNFIEIETQLQKKADKEGVRLSTHQKLSDILAFFYLQGYEHIDAIDDVLGVYLRLAGYYYEASYENGELAVMSSSDFTNAIRNEPGYSKEKLVKLPRYLIQLERIGLLNSREHGEDTYWEGDNAVLSSLRNERDIIEPVEKMLLEA